ncbi:hypothetical protein GCM10020000_25540 [Streptomyces olivoverticillatus]
MSRSSASSPSGPTPKGPTVPPKPHRCPRSPRPPPPAALLVSRLSKAARETLRFALALGGELPHQAHLPALAGDTHADAAIGDLLACGLISTVGAHYRLAAGVADQLLAEGYGTDAVSLALSAAQHYAWWGWPPLGHPRADRRRGGHDPRRHGRAGLRRRGRAPGRRAAAGPHRRPGVRGGPALGRLGAQPALRPGSGPAGGRGGRRSVFPP